MCTRRKPGNKTRFLLLRDLCSTEALGPVAFRKVLSVYHGNIRGFGVSRPDTYMGSDGCDVWSCECQREYLYRKNMVACFVDAQAHASECLLLQILTLLSFSYPTCFGSLKV